MIVCARREVKPFTEREISLLESFAAQAVLAIENARLFNEAQAKTHELEEALRYQTGSANILNVIASSPTDVQPVLKAIVESACELCEAYDAVALLKEGDDLSFSAHHGPIPMSFAKWPINRRLDCGPRIRRPEAVHVHDLLRTKDGISRWPGIRRIDGPSQHRERAAVARGREHWRDRASPHRGHPFSDKQIALLQTFADQAVIAIGNVRLFEEVQAKTHDLEEALRYQTGSANILNVIASSPTDVQPVLKAIVESACELCEAYDAVLRLRVGDDMVFGAYHGPIPMQIRKRLISRKWTAGRAFHRQEGGPCP